MDIGKAKTEVIAAGLKLVKTGLIARTWGNVSCRIDDKSFAITPSGMAYETLRPQDIVVVDITDLHYDGDVKPSSEKGVHAAVYALKPEVSFVIHTHQDNASVAGVLGKDVKVTEPEAKKQLGSHVVLAAYGLPGTKRLRKNVADALRKTDGQAVLMAHHGALCFGRDSGEAFAAAMALEDECRRFLTGNTAETGRCLGSSQRAGNAFIYHGEGNLVKVDIEAGGASDAADLAPEVQMHRAVYRAHSDVNVIRGCSRPEVVAASQITHKVKPLLDDFAQIIGPSARVIRETPNRVARALMARSAVLVEGCGALCCAGDEDDAEAIEMVLVKNCKAYLSSSAHGKIKPISPLECRLMRFVYTKKYSKMKKPGVK